MHLLLLLLLALVACPSGNCVDTVATNVILHLHSKEHGTTQIYNISIPPIPLNRNRLTNTNHSVPHVYTYNYTVPFLATQPDK
uniref:Secreted protein n=1 Tax=Caenorhabditis tropicalis TaxID=1561998 RepID=A0A1I7TN56_9PELO